MDMDILNLLEKIEDIAEDASKLPLSSKVMIDKDELLEVINEIRLKLPDEINRASWVAKERQRILNEAQSEADDYLEKIKEQQKMLDTKNSEIKELQIKMQQFENTLSQCCANFEGSNSTTKSQINSYHDAPILNQNQPNPFNKESIIKFFIPSAFHNAQIVIMDLAGRQLKSFDIMNAGSG